MYKGIILEHPHLTFCMDGNKLWALCQSCARPLIRSSDFGTNDDGTRNEEYCAQCFKNGSFTDPDIPLSTMVNIVALAVMEKTGMPATRAMEITWSVLPSLARWRKVDYGIEKGLDNNVP